MHLAVRAYAAFSQIQKVVTGMGHMFSFVTTKARPLLSR